VHASVDARDAQGDHAVCCLIPARSASDHTSTNGPPAGGLFHFVACAAAARVLLHRSHAMETKHSHRHRSQLGGQRALTTTALPYVNARPHIGHAFELVLADALARWQRQRGADVWLLGGTDDNSLKNARAAAAAGLTTRALVDANGADFRRLTGALGVDCDDFLQTSSDPRHAPGVARLWRACAARGDLYRRRYRGRYCVGCEAFLRDDELRDGRCPTHDSAPEIVEEENYFFRLSKYRESLLQAIESRALQIVPDERRNEVLAFIAAGLDDFSVSRSHARAHGWGIPVPDDPSQIVYVWFDALANYVTALDYASDGARFTSLWRATTDITHVVGKDILRFHAIYWPAILLSAGLALPTRICAHGLLTSEQKKIGKSAGNAVDPFALVDTFGRDSLRYYLLRHLHSTRDSDFSPARLAHAYDVELADQLGNLVRRVLALIARELGGVIAAPSPAAAGDDERALIAAAGEAEAEVAAAFARFALHQAVAAIWRFVAAANRYADRSAPWRLARAPGSAARLHTVLYHLAESLLRIACWIAPVVPDTAARIGAQLGVGDVAGRVPGERWGALLPGARIAPGEILFPKRAAAAR
jgi:methionyl-tRNA synthetase